MGVSVVRSGIKGAAIGGLTYVFCRTFDQAKPIEKAALVTILVALRELAEKGIKSKYPREPYFRDFLESSSRLVAIPCAMFIGRQLNFKATDYLQIVGLTTIGYNIYSIVLNLISSFRKQKQGK